MRAEQARRLAKSKKWHWRQRRSEPSYHRVATSDTGACTDNGGEHRGEERGGGGGEGGEGGERVEDRYTDYLYGDGGTNGDAGERGERGGGVGDEDDGGNSDTNRTTVKAAPMDVERRWQQYLDQDEERRKEEEEEDVGSSEVELSITVARPDESRGSDTVSG